MFFFKRSKVVVDCFTNNALVDELVRISPANEFYPDWWKNTPKEFASGITTTSTIKRCSGIIQNYQHGFILPMWSDLKIVTEPGRMHYNLGDCISTAVSHDAREWNNYVNPQEVGHMKLFSPWKLKSKSDTPFLFVQPYWNFKPFEGISIPSGVIDFKYQHSTNLNMFIRLQPNLNVTIKFGEPVAHLIPLTDKEVILKHHLVSDQEFAGMDTRVAFTNNYKKIKEMRKSKEVSKCPFHNLWK